MATEFDVINLRLPLDLGAAFRRAAEADDRSINKQAVVYIRRCLIADGRFQLGEPDVASVKPIRRVVRVAEATPAPASIARVVQEIVTGADLRGRAALGFERIIREHFPDIQSLADARGLGSDRWLDVQASPAIMRGLFPDQPKLVETALKMRLRQRSRDQWQAQKEAAAD